MDTPPHSDDARVTKAHLRFDLDTMLGQMAEWERYLDFTTTCDERGSRTVRIGGAKFRRLSQGGVLPIPIPDRASMPPDLQAFDAALKELHPT